jgi:plastocyanin
VRRSLLLTAAVIVAATVVVACGDDDDDTAADGRHPMNDSSSTDHGGMNHDETGAVAPGARRIEVGGRSYAFEPAQITVRAGEEVAIALTSEDTLHDFTVEEVDIHVVAAEAGQTEAGGLRVDEPGRYTFYCTVAGHRQGGMEGTLVVEGP